MTTNFKKFLNSHYPMIDEPYFQEHGSDMFSSANNLYQVFLTTNHHFDNFMEDKQNKMVLYLLLRIPQL